MEWNIKNEYVAPSVVLRFAMLSGNEGQLEGFQSVQLSFLSSLYCFLQSIYKLF